MKEHGSNGTAGAAVADLTRQALQAQLRLAQQSVDVLRSTVRGDIDPLRAGRTYVDAVRRESERYWRSAGELGVRYAGEVLGLGTRFTSNVLHDVGQSGRRPGRHHDDTEVREENATAADGDSSPAGTVPGGEPVSPRREEVLMQGPAGGRAHTTVTVTNTRTRTRRVELAATQLVSVPDGAPLGRALEVAPRSVTLPAGQEHEVTLGVELPAAVAIPGSSYRAEVRVTGGEEAVFDVLVEVIG